MVVPTSCEEDKVLGGGWTKMEKGEVFEEENIFHPDDEILDPKDTIKSPIQRVGFPG